MMKALAISNSILICFMLLILANFFNPSYECTLKLVHMDAPDSPYYYNNANDTLELRYKMMTEISDSRYRQHLQDLEEEARLQAHLVEARLKQVTWNLSSDDGLKAFSAILKRFSVESFIWVDDEGWMTELFVPSCNYSMNMYVKRLANEEELIKNDPRLIDDLRSGPRDVMKLRKLMVGFDGTEINVSVSYPLLYDTGHLKIHAADGFGSLEFPEPKREVSGMKSKIELVIVVNITDYGVDLENLKKFFGPELVISDPFPDIVTISMLYSVYF